MSEKLTLTEDKATAQESGGLVSFRPWTWRDRLRAKLFPPRYCELPVAPATHRDVFVCRVVSKLSVLDRLRVLVTGRVCVETRTVTENAIGDHKTESIFVALPPSWWDARNQHLK